MLKHILKYLFISILCVWMFCLCTIHVPGACGGQKGISDPLGLELEMVVGCHVGTGNQTKSSLKSNKSHVSSSPNINFEGFWSYPAIFLLSNLSIRCCISYAHTFLVLCVFIFFKKIYSQVWLCTPLILAFGRHKRISEF